jgi:hypothetical protein
MAFIFEKTITDRWDWFSEYYNVDLIWCIRVEPGREVEVGTGLMIFGSNTGRRTHVRDTGCGAAGPLGSVHIRVRDRRGRCRVRYAEYGHEVAGSFPVVRPGESGTPPPFSEPWNDETYKRLRNELSKGR